MDTTHPDKDGDVFDLDPTETYRVRMVNGKVKTFKGALLGP